jgi:hypothetical protein
MAGIFELKNGAGEKLMRVLRGFKEKRERDSRYVEYTGCPDKLIAQK